MGRILSIIGGGTLALLGVGAVVGSVGFYKARALNSDGRAFVTRILPQVGTVWDTTKILPSATPELQAQAQNEAAVRMGGELRRLGLIRAYDEPVDGGFRVSYVPSGKVAVANYTVTLHAEFGDTKLLVGLLKRGDEPWLINGLRIQSDRTDSARPEKT